MGVFSLYPYHIFAKNIKMNFAYLRVSTGHQVIDNQRNEIERYAQSKGITIDYWVTEVVSGKKKGKDRKLGALIRRMKKGDTLIVTEISRLSRTMIDIIAIVGELLRRGINLYSIKDGYSFDDSINSKVLIFAFGLVAEIERNLISLRTKEALALRKQQGIKLGRAYGYRPKTDMLMQNWDEICRMRAGGSSIAKVCKKYKVSYNTFKRCFNENSGKI